MKFIDIVSQNIGRKIRVQNSKKVWLDFKIHSNGKPEFLGSSSIKKAGLNILDFIVVASLAITLNIKDDWELVKYLDYSNIHNLKLDTKFFHLTANRIKRYEFRENDRGYCIGDYVELYESENGKILTEIDGKHTFPKAIIVAKITHILTKTDFEYIPKDWCILSLQFTEEWDEKTNEEYCSLFNSQSHGIHSK